MAESMLDPMEICSENQLKRALTHDGNHLEHASPKHSLEHPEAFPTPPLTASPVHQQSSDRQPSPAPSSSALSSVAPSSTERPPGSSAPPPKKRRKLTVTEKQEQLEAKEIKDREKAEQKAKKDEEKRTKDEEKRRKNEEKEAKQREKDMKKAEEEKEKEKKEKSQLRLNSFFARPKASSTLCPAASPLSTNRKEPVLGESADVAMVPQPKSTPQKSDYQKSFLSFELPSHTTCAPYVVPRDGEEVAALQQQIDILLQQLSTNVSVAAGISPITAFFTPERTASRGIWQPSAREIVESLNGSSHNPVDLTDDGGQRYGPEHLLNAVTMRHLHFAEDVRPPYFGSYTKRMSPKSITRLRRHPFSKVRKDTNYDYDSEAEWEEPEEGEDILSEGEDDEESVGSADEMDGFLDDEEGGDGKRRLITGDLKPISTGICWHDPLAKTTEASDHGLNLDDMKILFLLERPTTSINPFSAAYWHSEPAVRPAPPKFKEENITQVENGRLVLPKTPLQPRSSPNEAIVGAASGMKGPIMAVATGKSIKPAAKPLKDEGLAEFHEAVVGSNLNKIELLKALKKRFPKHTNETIKATLSTCFARVGTREADKVWRPLGE